MGRYSADVLTTLGANKLPSPDPADRPFTYQVYGYDLNNVMKGFDVEISLTNAGNPNGVVSSIYIGRKLYDTVNNDLYICTATGNSASAVWLNMTQHIVDKVAASSSAAPNILTLAVGQSLIANWSVISAPSGWNKDGETAFLSTLSSYNSGGTTGFINSAAGGSYLSRKAFEASQIRAGGTLPAGNYWVDDLTSSRTAGPRLTDALNNITVAGKTLNQINALLWSQGEADSASIAYGDITSTEYYNDLVWLKDFFFAAFVNLRKMWIRPIGRRSDSNNANYSDIRSSELLLATNYPYQVGYGSETYDLPMRDETGISDGVHRSGAGFATEGARAAREVASSFGAYTGNTSGAKIISATLTPGGIVVTVQHDKGTALANKAGTAYSGTPINITPTTGGVFKLLDSGGANIPISSVNITGASQITIVPSAPILTTGNTLYYASGAVYGVDLNSIPYDNAPQPLPVQAGFTAAVNGGMSAIETMPNLVSFFSPESMYNAGGTASDAVVWTKRAGSGGSARKDDTKPAPVYVSDLSSVITGGPVLPGWYFDGSSSQKLLVENALTGSSDFTLFVVATPNTTVSDPSTNNVLIGTSAIPTASVPLFLVRQTSTALQTLGMYCGSTGTSVNYDHSNTPTVITMRRTGSTCNTWNEIEPDNTFTVTGTPTLDVDTNPVYAIGNIPLHGTGSSDLNTTFRGAVHYIVLFDTALSDPQVAQIRATLAAAVGL